MECAHGVAWFLLFLHPCRTTFPCRFLFVLGIIKTIANLLCLRETKPFLHLTFPITSAQQRRKKKRKKHAHPYFSSTPPPPYCSLHPTPFSILPHFANPPTLSAFVREGRTVSHK
ncbi:hypothetical protein BKA57DRAFT_475200 [Linnemannia elongata]|nr:hypothetical protein BKA57DRAFT_475200 [Linnemannia elongata]